jgi:thiaminase II
MVSTSGSQLLPQDAVETLIKELLPLTTVLTPNIPEALVLLKTAGRPVPDPKSVTDLAGIAHLIGTLGPRYVLLKGGHLPLNDSGNVATSEADRKQVVNLLRGDNVAQILHSEYLNSKNTHGTGCSLASAIAANIAKGSTVAQAVNEGILYVKAGIETSQDLGKGNGPINHFHSTYMLPFARGGFIEYILNRDDVKGPWREHTHHDFVRQMQDGTLPIAKFRAYLIQDYLFLIQFARANSLAAYKAKYIEDIDRSAAIVRHIFQEMNLHIDYCKGFGLSKEDIINHEEKMACTAYTRYVLDIGVAEDWLALQIALLPCLLGYGVIAKRLYDDPKTKREGNIYWKWIENYVADDYAEAVRLGCGKLIRLPSIREAYANYVRTGGEACGKTVAQSDRGAGENLHTCDEGTTAFRLRF